MNKKKKIPVNEGNLLFVNIIFFYTRGSVTSSKKIKNKIKNAVKMVLHTRFIQS